MKSIRPFIQRKVIVLHSHQPVRQAAWAMREKRVGSVVVSDHRGHVIGIVTDRDIVTDAVTRSSDAEEVPLSQVMTKDPVLVDEGADIKRVVHLMESYGIRRVPVIERLRGDSVRCIGLVSLDDLIVAKAVSLDTLSRIVRAQLKRRILPGKGPAAAARKVDAKDEARRFFARLASKLDSKLEFSQGELEQVAEVFLGALVRRLHHTGSLRFIEGLPQAFQGSLLNQPTGPDESVDLGWLTAEMCRIFNVDDPTAYLILVRFAVALEEWCDPEILNHVKAQLPKDLRNLFAVAVADRSRLKGAA